MRNFRDEDEQADGLISPELALSPEYEPLLPLSLRVLGLGIGFFGIAYLGLALTSASIATLAAFFVAAGIAIGFVETAEHAAVAEHAPPDLRGSAFGALAAVQSLGNVAASAIAGLLWTTISARVAFLYLTAWMLLALCTLNWSAAHPTTRVRNV